MQICGQKITDSHVASRREASTLGVLLGMTERVYRHAGESPGGGSFFAHPLRPRCARPPLPKGEARDAHAVHWEVCREARPCLRARGTDSHASDIGHWLGMTPLRGVRGDAPQGYLLRCVGIAPYGRPPAAFSHGQHLPLIDRRVWETRRRLPGGRPRRFGGCPQWWTHPAGP